MQTRDFFYTTLGLDLGLNYSPIEMQKRIIAVLGWIKPALVLIININIINTEIIQYYYGELPGKLRQFSYSLCKHHLL